MQLWKISTIVLVFEASKVTNMHKMFYGCESLTYLDLSDLNLENLVNSSYMLQEWMKCFIIVLY